PPRAGFFGMPAFPSVLIDAHLGLRDRHGPEEALALIASRLEEAEEIVAELLVRTLIEVGEDKAEAVFEAAGAGAWKLAVDPARLPAEATVGLARRKALRPLARDVERTLGRVRGTLSEASLARLLAPLLAPAAVPEPAE